MCHTDVLTPLNKVPDILILVESNILAGHNHSLFTLHSSVLLNTIQLLEVSVLRGIHCNITYILFLHISQKDTNACVCQEACKGRGPLHIKCERSFALQRGFVLWTKRKKVLIIIVT